MYLESDDEIMDFMRLMCIEARISMSDIPGDIVLKVIGMNNQYVVNDFSSQILGKE